MQIRSTEDKGKKPRISQLACLEFTQVLEKGRVKTELEPRQQAGSAVKMTEQQVGGKCKNSSLLRG